MGGYFGQVPDSSLLPDIFLNLYDNMRQYGVRGKCYSVTNTISEFLCGDRLEVNFFNGVDSQINVALDSIVARLRRGQITGAALISDFIVTPDDGSPPSPMGLLQNGNTTSILLSGLDSGILELSLLGIRLKYRGVKSRRCNNTDFLGCWLDESSQQWKPLSRPAERPVYVLMLGLKKDDKGNSRMERAIDGFLTALMQVKGNMHIVTESEIFTKIPGDKKLKWELAQREHALRYNYNSDRNLYQCVPTSGDGIGIQLAGQYSGRDLQVQEFITMGSGRPNWITSVVARPDSFVVSIDCKIVEQQIRDNTIADTLTSELEFTFYRANIDLWTGWSCTQYAPHCTFGLTGLLEHLRATNYRGRVNEFITIVD